MTTGKAEMITCFALLLMGSASGFTNGTLLPSYLCDLKVQAKGGPQSLAGVLPFLTKRNATMTVAQYHNLNVPPYTMAQDLCNIGTVPGVVDKHGQKTFVVKAIDNSTTLVGLIVWVQKQDRNGTLQQIGRIVNPGLNMIPYPYGCNGDIGQTIVHRTALQRNSTIKSQSAPITWDIQRDGIMAGEKAQVAGICITQAKRGLPGGGFGKFVVDLIVAPEPITKGAPPVIPATATAKVTETVAGTTSAQGKNSAAPTTTSATPATTVATPGTTTATPTTTVTAPGTTAGQGTVVQGNAVPSAQPKVGNIIKGVRGALYYMFP